MSYFLSFVPATKHGLIIVYIEVWRPHKTDSLAKIWPLQYSQAPKVLSCCPYLEGGYVVTVVLHLKWNTVFRF